MSIHPTSLKFVIVSLVCLLLAVALVAIGIVLWDAKLALLGLEAGAVARITFWAADYVATHAVQPQVVVIEEESDELAD